MGGDGANGLHVRLGGADIDGLGLTLREVIAGGLRVQANGTGILVWAALCTTSSPVVCTSTLSDPVLPIWVALCAKSPTVVRPSAVAGPTLMFGLALCTTSKPVACTPGSGNHGPESAPATGPGTRNQSLSADASLRVTPLDHTALYATERGSGTQSYRPASSSASMTFRSWARNSCTSSRCTHGGWPNDSAPSRRATSFPVLHLDLHSVERTSRRADGPQRI
mmetsp:Transcript_160560/g.490810  ORF Transcript_160560/g.490810 Transcript_160560/m.490810 type:complete len:223 (+) Transcript_160560:385-1053(+)